MTKKDQSCCGDAGNETSCCRVEALVSVDDRGQMVLPKDLREKAGISAGDKLAIVSWEKGGKVCCFTLMKADDMADRVREVLGPVFKEIMG
jgi:antitoxin PrlF